MSRPKTTLPYNPVTQRMRAMIGTVPAEPAPLDEQGQPPERGQLTQAAKPAIPIDRRHRAGRTSSRFVAW
jgi:hypothetical protein